jgi:hypothetical protein
VDYHLDRRVILSDDPQYKNLYEWSLQEVDDDGKQIGRDLIPWSWSLNFVAVELSLTDQLNIEPDYQAPRENTKNAVKRTYRISGKMRPNGSGAIRKTSYSMLGTSRLISDFYLGIEELPEGETEPKCSVQGGVAQTFELDFRNEKFEDTIWFNLQVTSEQFTEYAAMITTSSLDVVVLRIGGVRGFYSDWSPSISTNSIKVLTSEEKHKVEIPEGWAFPPPRLGEVMETNVSFHVTKTMDTSFLDDGGADMLSERVSPAVLGIEPDAVVAFEADEQVSPAVRAPVPQARTLVDQRLVKQLSSIRLAAWVIAALLLALNLKSCG